MSLASYDDYKDSGFQWLGDVPAHWEIKRLSIICHFESGKAHEPFIDDDGDYICVNSRFVSTEGESRKFCTENLSPTQRGDILMVMSDLPNGRALAKAFFVDDDEPYAVNQRVCTIRAQQAIPKFLYYQLNRNPLFLRHDDGVNQTHLSNATFTKFPTLVPPRDEQKAISSFLDVETSKIDGLVSEQRRLIELLKEKRQAVISHAVTKGLNPNAPMKPSGIQWLGDVPQHWSVCRFSRAIDFQEGPGIMAIDFHEEGVPLVRVSGVKDRWVTLDGCNFLDPALVEKRWVHFRLEKGDLLISASASMGTVSEVDTEAVGAVPYTGLIRLFPKAGETSKDFIRSLVVSDVFMKQIDLLKAGATIQHFGPTHLRQITIPLPPVDEQIAISTYIDEQIRRFEMLIAEAERAIELLQERRTALISAAVTGKIDVRKFAYP